MKLIGLLSLFLVSKVSFAEIPLKSSQLVQCAADIPESFVITKDLIGKYSEEWEDENGRLVTAEKTFVCTRENYTKTKRYFTCVGVRKHRGLKIVVTRMSDFVAELPEDSGEAGVVIDDPVIFVSYGREGKNLGAGGPECTVDASEAKRSE